MTTLSLFQYIPSRAHLQVWELSELCPRASLPSFIDLTGPTPRSLSPVLKAEAQVTSDSCPEPKAVPRSLTSLRSPSSASFLAILVLLGPSLAVVVEGGDTAGLRRCPPLSPPQSAPPQSMPHPSYPSSPFPQPAPGSDLTFFHLDHCSSLLFSP